MFRKELITGILVAFFFMGFLGTAFAENSDKSILGSDEFTFDAPVSINNKAAIDHKYNQDDLALVGTEGGNWEFKFDTPETKADLAAKSYVYDQGRLASVGSEGGDWEFSFDAPEANALNESEAVVEKNIVKDAVCKGC